MPRQKTMESTMSGEEVLKRLHEMGPPKTEVTARALRSLGCPVPTHIPDEAKIRRNDVSFSTKEKGETGLVVRFTIRGPFRWRGMKLSLSEDPLFGVK